MSPLSIHASGLIFWYYFFAFLIAFAVVLFSTPVIRTTALKTGYVDVPSQRKVHQQPVARLGGVAIFTGTMVALMVVWLAGVTHLIPAASLPGLISVLLGSIGFFLIGVLDDLFGLSPIARLLIQVGIASTVWLAGVQIEFITLPGFGLIHLGWWSLPITVLWLAGVVNAINWIDGLDGLASGVSGIAAIASFVICIYTGQPASALIVITLLGSLIGFLFYNFNPAKIFMGDGGSYFIGFLLAGVGIIGLVKSATATAIALPFLVLAVPILDMSLVIVSRLRRGVSPFIADKRHLHHRLLRAGISHRDTVLVIYAIALWISCLAMLAVGVPSGSVILGSATGLLGCMTWKAWQSTRQD